MSTASSQEISEMDCSSQTSFEEIEGIADQLLIGHDEEDRLLEMGVYAQPCASASIQQRCTECSTIKNNYKSFIDHLIKQLPVTKRKHAELQYKELEEGKGNVELSNIIICSCFILYRVIILLRTPPISSS
jgi:hypothetical protein